MNRFLVLFGLVAALLATVNAHEHLCGSNWLRMEEGSTVGDLICAENDTDVDSREITLTPLSALDLSDTLGVENRVLKFIKSNVSGVYDESLNEGATRFALKIGFEEDDEEDDSNSTVVASAVMASVSYDFDGDEVIDRVELYEVFLVSKTSAEGDDNETESEGEEFLTYIGTSENIHQVIGQDFADLEGGSIKLTVWSPFGTSALKLKIGGFESEDNETDIMDTSFISLPFEFGSENETSGGSGGAGGSEDECCESIDKLESDLQALMTRVDALSSRLLSITRNCCEASATATAAVSGTGIGTATAVETASGTETVVETATGTATGEEEDA